MQIWNFKARAKGLFLVRNFVKKSLKVTNHVTKRTLKLDNELRNNAKQVWNKKSIKRILILILIQPIYCVGKKCTWNGTFRHVLNVQFVLSCRETFFPFLNRKPFNWAGKITFTNEANRYKAKVLGKQFK